MTIPIASIDIGPEEEALVLEVLRSGHLVQGPMVERLEGAFRDLAGTRHAVAVSSGTAALVAALQALEVGPGDEVVTSPFTFVATLNAILATGATATFADIGGDFTIDVDALAAQVGSRTRVVMPVHLYGLPADMPAIMAIAARAGAAVVEDAAQAHGARVAERAVGSFGVGCFSLYATKNVTTGEGGVVTCDDDAVAERLRLLRNQGMRERYRYEIVGHNYRLTDLQAALGIPQLARLPRTTAARRRNADALFEGLREVPGLVLATVPPGREHVWHQLTVRVTPDARLDRNELARGLAERGIDTGIYYPRVVFDYDCYRDDPRVRVADVPRARAAAEQVLSLPVHPGLSDGDIGKIIDAVRELLGC